MMGVSLYSLFNAEPEQTVKNRNRIAFFVQDESGEYNSNTSKEFPKDGYVLDHVECLRGGTVTQNPDTKEISANFSHTDSCNLYFSIEECPKSSIYKTITLSNGLKAYDESATQYSECSATEMYIFDHPEAKQTTSWSNEDRKDYRYIGASPNNWVKFNDENWRIIGVFTVETSAGKKEQLIKLIRNSKIAALPWDMRTASVQNGVNDWSQSSLNILLNGDYYVTENSFKYEYTSIYNTSTTVTIAKGLNQIAREQIEKVKWYLGGSKNYQNLGAINYYAFERGETVYTGRMKNIFANVGLLYPSDYAFTYSKGIDYMCYTNSFNCETSRGGSPNKGWMYNIDSSPYGYGFWTISPTAYNSYTAYDISGITGDGHIGGNTLNQNEGIHPTVYLKSTIKIVSGDGSQENPYVLG